MTFGEEIVTLDDVAATLRALASGALRFDSDVVYMLADYVSRAADHAQEVADLRAALALLTPRADSEGEWA